MTREYELWLDESGDFKQEEEKRQKQYNASLVGGILIESSKVNTINFEELLAGTSGHACEMKQNYKLSVVLPALERLQSEYGATQVFFENTLYEEENTNRQLYLRIIAEGILQLLFRLDAVNESVSLNVIIAQRQDVSAQESERRIESAEYEAKLREFMLKKQRERKILLDEHTRCSFCIEPAHKNQKLQMADFACNTRFTRSSGIFKAQKERLNRLYKDAYFFSLHELGSQNYIKMSLVRDNISDAVMELCTTRDKLDIGKEVQQIVKRMESMSYFLVKAQMKQCMSEVQAYALQTEDFKVGIQMLEKVRTYIIPEFERSKFPVENFAFAVLLQLADMYLRSGDIYRARQTVNECRRAQERIGNSLEALFSYYQLIEKEALLCIDEFDYQRGADIMESACVSFENILNIISVDDNLSKRFPELRSEYYGDALCMRLYALMFLQREHAESYEKMVELSNIALKQYPDIESELERHRQYRCHIEAEAGNYEKALYWLFLAKGIACECADEKECINFLDAIYTQESLMARQYYVMYYLHVMSESAIHESPLAKKMYEALVKQKRIMRNLGLLDNLADTEEMIELNLEKIKQARSNLEYHPMEVVYWKFGTYLCVNGHYMRACEYYENALEICRVKDYLTMRVTALGICAEEIYCLLLAGKKKMAVRKYHELMQMFEKISKDTKERPMKTETLLFVETMRRLVEESQTEDDELNQERLWSASRKITY